MKGRAIVISSWVGTALLSGTAVPPVLGLEAMGPVALVVALGMFFVSLALWAYAFAVALARSAAGENVAVANLFCFDATVPRQVRAHLFGSVLVCTVVALAVAARDPFTVLAPMWPLGWVGCWGARYGTFPPRATTPH
ncbi:MAG: hypothetical protein ACOYNI_12820 [Acidimicrobiia bacterium]